LQNADGAGDKTFADPVSIKCLITGEARVKISNTASRATLLVASRDSGDILECKYVVYFDYTSFPIQKQDELLIEGKRLPVLGSSHITPINKGEHTLGVIYL
jgi:hypothetical protein